LPFIGVTPCRVADTRGNGFTGAYGPPSLVGNATRSFTISGQCSIPATAEAVSFNFVASNVGGAGDLRVFPAGGSVPLVSTLNYNASTPNIANAAIVPLGTGGAITVQADAVSIDLIIDLNGYYAGAGVDASGNTFLGPGAGNFTMTGNSNTGIGALVLLSNTTGSNNTAVGGAALEVNADGSLNTATGVAALRFNSGGSGNTAIGYHALYSNTTSELNTAIGIGALEFATGQSNTAVGSGALDSLTSGDLNVAVGAGALQYATSGAGNIALGRNAGVLLNSGDDNMYLGNEGVASESATIRIGSGSVHTRLFVAGVLTSGVSGTAVLISGTGQLGIASSSARYKEEIRDMGDASDRLSKLRPVTFRYKGHADDPMQFGLIAEEVEKVLPELVCHSASGQPEAVLYHEMPAMLLNELQKQHREIQELKSELSALRAIIDKRQAADHEPNSKED
jgi:hypothetical protein